MEDMAVIDWNLGLKLAGNKREVAEELLNRLAASLENEVKQIRSAWQNKNFAELHQRIHKLHGAVCYCGTPRLKKIISTFEHALKRHEIDNYSSLLDQFEMECHLLIQSIGL